MLIIGIATTTLLNAQEIKKSEKIMHIKFIREHNGSHLFIDTVLINPTKNSVENVIKVYKLHGEAAKEFRKNFRADIDDKDIEKILSDEKKEGSTVIYESYNERDKLPDEMMRLSDTAATHNCGSRKVIIVDINYHKTIDDNSFINNKKDIIVRRVIINDLSKEDLADQKIAASKNPLKVSQINLFPNPNNGLMKLSFNLPGRGTTQIIIVNKDGKTVYEETIKDFTGDYEKEISLNEHQKGYNYLKVQQGNDILYKKISVE